MIFLYVCFYHSQLHSSNRLARDKQTLDQIEKTALTSVNVVVFSLLQKVQDFFY